MHYNVLLATKDGYMFVNGKLMAYEFKSATVNFSNGEVKYTCMLGGRQETLTVAACPEIFADETEFQQGNSISPKNFTWVEAVRSAFFYVGADSKGEVYDMYLIRNNEVVSVPAPKDGFVYSNYRTTHSEQGKYYASRDEALLHCDLVVVDEEGQETTVLSPAKRVALTQEQKEAVEALEIAFKRAEEAGVRIYCDNSSDSIFVCNDKDIKLTEYGYNCGTISEHGYRINDILTPTRMSALAISVDDTSIHVKFKD